MPVRVMIALHIHWLDKKTAWLDTKKSRKNLKLLGNDANLFIEKPQ